MQQLLNTQVRCIVSSMLLAGVLTLPHYAHGQEADFVYDDELWDEYGKNEDPWEPMNRAIFRFNETVDRWTLKPLAQGYQKVTPDVLEDGVHNVFRNLGETHNLVNNLLQFKLRDAGVDTARFFFNTTFGLFGFFDVAT